MLRTSLLRDRASLRAAAVLTAGLLGSAALVGCGADDDTAADPGGETSETAGASDTASPSDSAAPSDPASTDAAADPSASAEAGFDLPSCTSVWTVGQQFPANYEGCLDADGEPVDAGGQYCEFGKPIFTFGSNFYAVENGPVIQTEQPLGQDQRYQKALSSCGG